MRLPIKTRPLADIEADWPRLSGLIDEIMNLPPASRETFIGALPPPDDRLADTLRELLALQAKVETEDFMDDLPVFPGVTASGEAAGWDAAGVGGVGRQGGTGGLVEGAEVGPYRLLRAIGEGGMGAVWLAERADGTLKRKVALKLPRLAWAQDLAARMARERDILAGLEHPNIARLYDAGLDAQGRPWLALEFVEGRDLTTYCDAERLDLRARVRLFMQVLDAVQYAHASLVIHRDIKPANILVTPRGEARLLDFGIARLEEGAAEAGPDLTRTGVSAMTPRYASPEQVQGARLTVASDIYSLGVVLHELLTGETPYVLRRSSRAELEQAILDADLRVPSRLKAGAEAAAARATTPERIARDLRGDLDAVLLRALARTPAARYASAAAFRDDLERWLEGRPVSALPPSRLHALRKFVARNRLAVAASAAAALALVAVSVVAVLQAQRATREATTATTAKEFLVKIYGEADPLNSDTTDPNARALLERAERDLETQFAGEPALRAEVMKTLQQAWQNLGEPARVERLNDQRAGLLLSLGRREEAFEALMLAAEAALSERRYADTEKRLSEISEIADMRKVSADFLGRYHYLRGALHSERGQPERAADAFTESISATRRLVESTGRGHEWLFLRIVGKVMAVRMREGRDAATRDLLEAKSLIPKISKDDQRWLAPWTQLAAARYRLGDLMVGWPEVQRAVSTTEADFGDGNPTNSYERTIWMLYCNAMQRSERAADWLRSLDSSPGQMAKRAYSKDADWLLAAAASYLAVDDRVRFDVTVAALKDLLASRARDAQQGFRNSDSELILLLARAELRWNRPEVVRRLLATGESGVGGDRFSGVLAHERSWVSGNAHRLLGEIGMAADELRAAESAAAAQLGDEHPEVALIRMDLGLALADRASGAADSDVRSLVMSARAALRSSLPEVHPRLRFLDSLGTPSGDPSPVADAELRSKLIAHKRSQFNDWF